MNIVVTGGSGHTGKAVVEHLIEYGYKVRIVDQLPPDDAGSPYTLCNLEDYGETVAALEGADAVLHLAAIPRPTYHPHNVVFRTNVLAAYNVFEAAAVLGIQRVVYASSISVTGYPFYERFFEPLYVPIDEDHPAAPQDVYGLSKHLGEEIARANVRRGGISVISLRMPWIHTPETFKRDILPYRDDPHFGASNLWLYVDARDVAQAFRLGLETELKGYHVYYTGARDTFMEVPSIDLVNEFYPNAKLLDGFGGRQSLISCRKAEQELGYQAEYDWEMYL